MSQKRRSVLDEMAPGMIIGGLVGLVAGAVVTEEHTCDPRSFFCVDPPEKLLGALAGSAVGMTAGAYLSWALVPAESWSAASPPRVAAAAGPGGATVAMRLPLGRAP